MSFEAPPALACLAADGTDLLGAGGDQEDSCPRRSATDSVFVMEGILAFWQGPYFPGTQFPPGRLLLAGRRKRLPPGVPPEADFNNTILNDFFYRGFSLHPDGKSFLTSVARVKTQIYLMKDFDRTVRLFDRWW